MRSLSLVSVLFLLGCAGGGRGALSQMPGSSALEVQGHRGCRGLRPENTLPAFQLAIELGVDVLELDLGLSRDDVLVVVHDPEVNPGLCTARRPLPGQRFRDLSWEEIGGLDCGSRRNPRFPGQRVVPGTGIPRLEQVLDLLDRHPRLRANLEIKTFPDRRELTRPPADFARLLVGLLDRRGLLARVVVQSFDPEALRAVARLEGRLALAALIDEPASLDAALGKQVGEVPMPAGLARIVSPRFNLLRAGGQVQALQARGLRVVPWTVNEPEDLRRLIEWRVDGLITDYPDRLLELLGRRSSPPH